VPRIDRHTFPFAYKFGLNLTVPPPVVIKLDLMTEAGYHSTLLGKLKN